MLCPLLDLYIFMFLTLFLSWILSGMSGAIPSFVQPSDKYEDLFPDNELAMLEAPIEATPIFQTRAPSSGRPGPTPADRNRLSQASRSLAFTPETHSAKWAKIPYPSNLSQEIQQFYRLTDGQIPWKR